MAAPSVSCRSQAFQRSWISRYETGSPAEVLAPPGPAAMLGLTCSTDKLTPCITPHWPGVHWLIPACLTWLLRHSAVPHQDRAASVADTLPAAWHRLVAVQPNQHTRYTALTSSCLSRRQQAHLMGEVLNVHVKVHWGVQRCHHSGQVVRLAGVVVCTDHRCYLQQQGPHVSCWQR